MAHFAEIDDNNIVLRVLVVHDSEVDIWPVAPFSGKWIQCSYNGNIRKNFAGIGYQYDSERDAFIAPRPDNAIGFDEDSCQWIVPVEVMP